MVVSIPEGAIEGFYEVSEFIGLTKFQYPKVRLKGLHQQKRTHIPHVSIPEGAIEGNQKPRLHVGSI